MFLGNPADSGEGNFAPDQFAQFVVGLADIGVTVNVFFDETVLPQEASVGASGYNLLAVPRVRSCLRHLLLSPALPWAYLAACGLPPPLPPRQPIVGQCQVHCGGVSANDDDSLCKCDGSSNPHNCLWDRCTPYPSNGSEPHGAPPCCCASMDIKMQWVGARAYPSVFPWCAVCTVRAVCSVGS